MDKKLKFIPRTRTVEDYAKLFNIAPEKINEILEHYKLEKGRAHEGEQAIYAEHEQKYGGELATAIEYYFHNWLCNLEKFESKGEMDKKSKSTPKIGTNDGIMY